jgi:diguanylate cyclase (GGDEF)-like protein
MFEVRHYDPELRRKGRILALILVGMAIAALALIVINTSQGHPGYNAVNLPLLALLGALYLLNRAGYVRTASVGIVILSSAGALLLLAEPTANTYTAMTIPVLIASSMITPWSGFVVVALLAGASAVLQELSLALIIVFVVALISYLFADSLNQAHRQSRYQASHDALTDLPNRLLLINQLEQALQRAKRNGNFVAILYLDLDGFKIVNDSLGHEVGDKLLVQIGPRIKECLRSEDVVARLGGDEFTVLLRDLDDISEAVGIASRIAASLRRPFSAGEHELNVSASVGISLGHSENADPENVLQQADIAMYQAKQEGRNYELFHSGMHEAAIHRLALQANLQRAVNEWEFEVYYQPKVRLDTGRLVGMEALVRWGNPNQELVMPSEFIPLAEETGLIVPIGQRVMEIACHQAREWHDRYGDSLWLAMSVNLSARQFQAPNLIEEVRWVLKEARIAATHLELEITESTMVGNEQHAVGILQELIKLGLICTVDDFGKGYSSLSNLKNLPFSSLKIDKSFVKELGVSSTDEAMVRFIVEMAHYLELEVTAEGIENPRQLEVLKEMRCDFGQGYYFSEPLCSADAEAFIKANGA